mmetsp:Transcript_9301/g.19173  ORF Transcript_9301/g.19173 Transcript_9301/m.19173 type:complete len:299 (+) Transcript_9301:686-1582(+)
MGPSIEGKHRHCHQPESMAEGTRNHVGFGRVREGAAERAAKLQLPGRAPSRRRRGRARHPAGSGVPDAAACGGLAAEVRDVRGGGQQRHAAGEGLRGGDRPARRRDADQLRPDGGLRGGRGDEDHAGPGEQGEHPLPAQGQAQVARLRPPALRGALPHHPQERLPQALHVLQGRGARGGAAEPRDGDPLALRLQLHQGGPRARGAGGAAGQGDRPRQGGEGQADARGEACLGPCGSGGHHEGELCLPRQAHERHCGCVRGAAAVRPRGLVRVRPLQRQHLHPVPLLRHPRRHDLGALL